mgnify:CR=1 FL=1
MNHGRENKTYYSYTICKVLARELRLALKPLGIGVSNLSYRCRVE